VAAIIWLSSVGEDQGFYSRTYGTTM